MKTAEVIQMPLTGAWRNGRQMRPGEFVPTAAMTARKLSDEELLHPTRLMSLYEEREKLVSGKRRLLPLETELGDGIQNRLRIVDLEIARHEGTAEFDLPTISPKFLSWRTKNGFPGFSIFTLNSDTTTVTFGPSLDFGPGAARFSLDQFNRKPSLRMVPEVPVCMSQCYLDRNLFRMMEMHCQDKGIDGLQLKAKYSGVMPQSVREKIYYWLNRPADAPRFEQIFIIAEAPSEAWDVKEIPKKDPLVVGMKRGLLWLIDAYDLTPTEKFITDLFVDAKPGAKLGN